MADENLRDSGEKEDKKSNETVLSSSPPESGDEPEKKEEEGKISEQDEKIKKALLLQLEAMSSGAYSRGGSRLPGGSRATCLTCSAIALVSLFIGLIFLMNWGLKFIKEDFLSDSPNLEVPQPLLKEEEESLSAQLELLNQASDKANKTGEPVETEIILTERQANFLMAGMKTDREIGRVAAARIYPDGEKADIRISMIFNRNKYINAALSGRPVISNYRFSIDPESVSVGNLKNPGNWGEKIIRRIDNDLESLPERVKPPFRIKNMTIENSLIKLDLVVKPGG